MPALSILLPLVHGSVFARRRDQSACVASSFCRTVRSPVFLFQYRRPIGLRSMWGGGRRRSARSKEIPGTDPGRGSSLAASAGLLEEKSEHILWRPDAGPVAGHQL